MILWAAAMNGAASIDVNPSGQRSDGPNGGKFHDMCDRTNFWTTTDYTYNNHSAWYRELQSNYSSIYRSIYFEKAHGFSVRCVKD